MYPNFFNIAKSGEKLESRNSVKIRKERERERNVD